MNQTNLRTITYVGVSTNGNTIKEPNRFRYDQDRYS